MLSPMPLTNTLPALSVFIIGLSFLEEDAWFGFLGVFSAVVAIVSVVIIHILFLLSSVVVIDTIKDFILGLN